DEEHRRVVAHHVPDTLIRVELEGESAHVALGVRRATLTGHGGKAKKALGLFADVGEDAGFRIFRDVVGDGHFAVGTRTFGMDGALWDALAVLVGEFFEQLIVLHQQGPPRACGYGVLVVCERVSAGGRDDFRCAGHKLVLVLSHSSSAKDIVEILVSFGYHRHRLWKCISSVTWWPW